MANKSPTTPCTLANAAYEQRELGHSYYRGVAQKLPSTLAPTVLQYKFVLTSVLKASVRIIDLIF